MAPIQNGLIFDISQKTFDWTITLWGIGIVVLVLVFSWIGKRNNWPRWQIGFVVAIFALILLARGAVNGYLALKTLQEVYGSGKYSVVQGQITNFVEFEPHKHAESFSVGDKSFSYWDGEPRPGFHTIRANGGPLYAGRNVKIGYVGEDIVRIELLPSDKHRENSQSEPGK